MPKIDILKINAEDTWHIRHRVMWPNMPFDFVKLDSDFKGVHFGLFKDGKLISIVSLFIENNQAQFRKFATEISEQGKGYGTMLLTYLMDEVENLNLEKVWCNARIDKTDYYKQFGLHKTDNKYTKAGIDFVILEKDLQV